MTERPTQTDDEQRHVAELLRSFDAEPAPARLHHRVEALVAEHEEGSARRNAEEHRNPRLAGRAPRRRPLSVAGFLGAGVVAAAVVVVVAFATIFSGGAGTPTPGLRQAAAPTLRAATLPAPPESSTDHAQLAAAVDDVPFPYWEDRFGWRSTGTRSDLIDGRMVTTVFYADAAGRRIGYAILAGSPAPRIDAAAGGVTIWRGGVPYRLLTVNGVAAVTWLRDGHLCVVSGRGVSSATLLRLASWSDRDATAS
jgi:hypothetical protein